MSGAAEAPQYPAYYAELVDRAATMLHARWHSPPVEFTWWADGEEHRYLARMEWCALGALPRVIVCDGPSGDFRCQSKEGALHEIDPTVVIVDVAPDEVDRHEWEQAQRRKGKCKP